MTLYKEEDVHYPYLNDFNSSSNLALNLPNHMKDNQIL